VTARWVAGDEVYGTDPKLRKTLEDRGVGYVLAVACTHRVRTGAGNDPRRRTRRQWQRLSAGNGSKGPRIYDCAWISIEPEHADAHGQRWLLIRRNNAYRRAGLLPLLVTDTGAAARAGPRRPPPLDDRGILPSEQDPHLARPEPGPPRTSWHRWTILAMLAHAFLAVLTATERTETSTPPGLIALTCNEIHRLFNTLIVDSIRDLRHRLHWSTWRRRHQHRARTSHYQRRQAIPTRDHELRLSY
jgi:hypothetical protein